MLLDKEQRNNMVKLDEGYYIFQTIRNSPAYFDAKRKDVMAMVQQLGIPTIFYSYHKMGQPFNITWQAN